ncbi:hypothetical protein [Microbacterium sp. KR10-403]|uniref:hypothetical protein n=1 Tax=Microbacterium sp. KR10-403 TaxID=3158581 RepID=UPI0032E4EF98
MSMPNAHHAPVTPIQQEVTLDDLLKQRAAYKADAEYIQDQIEKIDAQIIDRLGTVGTHQVGDVKVQVREYTRTDTARIQTAYPAAQFPQLYVTKTVLDEAAVKQQFAPDVLEGFKLHGKKSVVVK